MHHRSLGRARGRVLAYHWVGDGPESPLVVPARAFHAQLDFLHRRGHRFVSVSRYLSGSVPDRAVLLTFDDGYETCYSAVFPLLAQRNISGLFFPIGATLASGSALTGVLNVPAGARFLRAAHVREMHAAGMSFGVHGFHHRPLRQLPADEVRRELRDNKAALEQVLGTEVTTVCYPLGSVDSRVIDIARSCGFTAGFVTPRRLGIPQSQLSLRRIGIYATDHAVRFRFKMSRVGAAAGVAARLLRTASAFLQSRGPSSPD